MTDGIAGLEARVRDDLRLLAYPAPEWVPPRPAPDGGSFTDVLIVGAGQGGLAVAFGLLRERVTRVRIVDAAAAGREGPWLGFARMETLRSPKFLTGPDLGVPSLTFQAWYEAGFGAAAWEALGKIPRETWAGYLAWLRRVLAIPVENETGARSVEPVEGGFRVALVRPGGSETVYARQVVLATGIEGAGAWYVPPDLTDGLPRDRWAHAAEPIDFARLRGRRVGILGAAASAFDNAAAALEAGAGAVHVFSRRPAVQPVQPYKHLMWAGFLRHFADLDDAWRWRFMNHLLAIREALPTETWQRTTRHPDLRIHTGSPWLATAATDAGVAVTTPKGRHEFDFLIFGTGFVVDLERRPELSSFAARIATWGDRYRPPPGEGNPWIARYPYLDPGFGLTAKAPGDAPFLSAIRLFTFGATLSLGFSGSSLNCMKYAVPRLVQAITRDLFTADAERHLAALVAYRVPEFDAGALPPGIMAED